MRSRPLASVLLLALAAPPLPASLAAAESPRIGATPFEIHVVSVETAVSVPVYTGSGGAIKAPDGPMGGIVVARDADGKTGNYLRASITAEPGRTLVRVGVSVLNTGKSQQSLRLGDLKVVAPGAVLMAIGEGTHPFTKDEAVLTKVVAGSRQIAAGEKLPLTYVFSVKTDAAPGKLVYKGKQSVDLKGVAQPAPAG